MDKIIKEWAKKKKLDFKKYLEEDTQIEKQKEKSVYEKLGEDTYKGNLNEDLITEEPEPKYFINKRSLVDFLKVKTTWMSEARKKEVSGMITDDMLVEDVDNMTDYQKEKRIIDVCSSFGLSEDFLISEGFLIPRKQETIKNIWRR